MRTTFVKDEQYQFATAACLLPARLTVEQAAWVLNCQVHDVPILVATRLLKPLGNPPPNGIKFFATVDLLALVKDRTWLAKNDAHDQPALAETKHPAKKPGRTRFTK